MEQYIGTIGLGMQERLPGHSYILQGAAVILSQIYRLADPNTAANCSFA